MTEDDHDESPESTTAESPISLALAADVRQYFHEAVTGALTRQRVDVQEETSFYLVNLLADFLTARQLFVEVEGGGLVQEPLAFMFKRAAEAPREERARHLRRMGDTALYMSGFFSDAISRGLVDVDYYAAMGGRAYDALSGLSRGEQLAAVFRELAVKFLRLVDVLNEIAERAAVRTNAGLLRVYERYARTGSTRLRGVLAESGMLIMTRPVGAQ